MPTSPDNLNSTGEREIIREIIASLNSVTNVTIPPGDDCAAVRLDSKDDELLLTSDPVFAGIHFDDTASPNQIGHKAAGRVLSDLAAMGAQPKWVLLNIAAPAVTPPDDLIRIVQGAQALCTSFEASIVGGDLTRAESLSVNAFGCGTAPAGSAITRGGACAGDSIYVTGRLGDSRKGKHLSFTPRVAEGLWLRQNTYASAMIDLSDGLATDLRHILESSSTGAEIQITSIPVAESLEMLSGPDAINHALCDGEDFELLFTVPKQRAATLQDEWRKTFELPLSCIGSITENTGMVMAVSADGATSEMTAQGFDHFGEKDI
jgi:thiamine-monophosphate kinase